MRTPGANKPGSMLPIDSRREPIVVSVESYMT